MIEYSRDSLLTSFGKATLNDRYLLPGENSPQDAFMRAAKAFADDEAHAKRLYDYASNLWFMFATPLLSNGGTTRGLPISCYLNFVPDSRKGLNSHYEENAWLASMGGGIGGYWGGIRSDGTDTSSGSRSSGSIPFVHIVDSQMLAFSQGKTRRGSYAAYQNINHPEIEEFIQMRKPSGGDVHRKCLNLHHGVNITDDFMSAVIDNKPFDLIDPHTKKVTKTVQARELWQLILETRMATGEPYIHFVDTTNQNKPEVYKKLGLNVVQSNLCSEIVLATNEERTAVCCLSSVNLEKYDEWKDNLLFIADLIRMLDNVITIFCLEAPDELDKAIYSAARERSLGLGAMGFHSYLQKNNIPFEGPIAVGINEKIFKHIRSEAEKATIQLAKERGACPDARDAGVNVRNVHLLAIAPNATSSIICGNTSPGVEPFAGNAFVHKTLSGSFLVKNPHLAKLLESKGKNDEETWQSIIVNKGSVQHLDYLDEWEKKVFKTAFEIDQRAIIDLASRRQKYIDQAQSINLFFAENTDLAYFNTVHLKAWFSGLKTLYYVRSRAAKSAEVVSEKVERVVRKDSDEGCIACEG